MEDKLLNIDYQFFSLKKKRWIFFAFATLLISFVLYFPLLDIATDKINKVLILNTECPIQIQELGVELFLPKLVVTNLKIPAICLGDSRDTILAQSLLYFRGPSFSPLGLSFKLQTNLGDSPFAVLLGLGFNKIKIKIDEQKIDFEKLPIINSKFKLNGVIELNAIIESDFAHISSLKLNILSNDFIIPAQNISGLNLPTMDLHPLILKLNSKSAKLWQLENLSLGSSDSSIRMQSSGSIQVNPASVIDSNLDLLAELSISDDFMNQFSIFKILLSGYTKKDKFYQMKIKGPLISPTPSPF